MTRAKPGLKNLRLLRLLHIFGSQKFRRANQNVAPGNIGLHATAERCGKVASFDKAQALLFRRANDGARQGMFAGTLCARRQLQKIVFGEATFLHHSSGNDCGLAFGERASFVHNEGVYGGEFFQRFGVAD